jgi:hypothetical protein
MLYIKMTNFLCIYKYIAGDSGERGRGEILIPIPILDSGDQNSPYLSPNRWISHGFAGNGAPLTSLYAFTYTWICEQNSLY